MIDVAEHPSTFPRELSQRAEARNTDSSPPDSRELTQQSDNIVHRKTSPYGRGFLRVSIWQECLLEVCFLESILEFFDMRLGFGDACFGLWVLFGHLDEAFPDLDIGSVVLRVAVLNRNRIIV